MLNLLQRIRRWIAFFCIPGMYLLALPTDSLAAASPKESERLPYALFDGMDLQAGTNGGVYPVVGFTKKRIYVAQNGNRNSLSTKSRISYSLRRKLSEKWVDLEVLETERFYSKLNSEFATYSSAVSQFDRDQDRLADYELGRRSSVSSGNVKRMPKTRADLSSPDNDIVSEDWSASYEGLSREVEQKLLDPDKYADSLRVLLSMNVDELYKGVYLVLIAQIDSPATEPDARPLIQVVGQLKPEKTRRVKAIFKNLPEGFNLLGLDIHVYSQGEEIPHAGSGGLRQLSEEEAFQYSLSKYMKSGGEAEPVLFRSLQTKAIATFLSEKEIMQIKANFTVHPDGSTTVDLLNTQDDTKTEKLVSMLEDVRFFPAMVNGEALEYQMTMPLSNLVK